MTKYRQKNTRHTFTYTRTHTHTQRRQCQRRCRSTNQLPIDRSSSRATQPNPPNLMRLLPISHSYRSSLLLKENMWSLFCAMIQCARSTLSIAAPELSRPNFPSWTTGGCPAKISHVSCAMYNEKSKRISQKGNRYQCSDNSTCPDRPSIVLFHPNKNETTIQSRQHFPRAAFTYFTDCALNVALNGRGGQQVTTHKWQCLYAPQPFTGTIVNVYHPFIVLWNHKRDLWRRNIKIHTTRRTVNVGRRPVHRVVVKWRRTVSRPAQTIFDTCNAATNEPPPANSQLVRSADIHTQSVN